MNESIPVPGGLPLLGNVLSIGRDPFGFVEDDVADHGPVFRVSVPGLSFVCYAEPALVERVLVTDRDRYEKDPRERNLLGPLLGDGLLTARGETWERGREQVQPAFYPGRLRAYGEVILERTDGFVQRWSDGQRVDAYEWARGLTLSIVGSVVFGVDGVEEIRTISRAADAITGRFEPSSVPLEVPLWVPTPANRRYRRAVDDLDDVIADLLDRRRASPGSGDGLCATLLAAADGGAMSDEQVRDHLLTMLLAGHETTAIALTYAMALLATHPDEQARVLEEVREPETVDASTALPRTDRAIQETLRLYPPTYLLFRQAVVDDVVAGYEIPAGTRICLPQWGIHRDERLFDAPRSFRPDRWLEPDAYPDFAYFPFGGGPRACIGRRFALLELRLALATILRTVSLEATPETQWSPTPALTSRPDGPVPVRVRR
ncbi:cytochrome P450 [Saliphagus sp. GCM10025308]